MGQPPQRGHFTSRVSVSIIVAAPESWPHGSTTIRNRRWFLLDTDALQRDVARPDLFRPGLPTLSAENATAGSGKSPDPELGYIVARPLQIFDLGRLAGRCSFGFLPVLFFHLGSPNWSYGPPPWSDLIVYLEDRDLELGLISAS
jgi:hypothetical protein